MKTTIDDLASALQHAEHTLARIAEGDTTSLESAYQAADKALIALNRNGFQTYRQNEENDTASLSLKPRDMAALLNRAAAVIDDPESETRTERDGLAADLCAEAVKLAAE